MHRRPETGWARRRVRRFPETADGLRGASRPAPEPSTARSRFLCCSVAIRDNQALPRVRRRFAPGSLPAQTSTPVTLVASRSLHRICHPARLRPCIRLRPQTFHDDHVVLAQLAVSCVDDFLAACRQPFALHRLARLRERPWSAFGSLAHKYEVPSITGLDRANPTAALQLHDSPGEFIAEDARDLLDA